MSIGDLARRTGVDIPTLRRWERYDGLLTPTRTPGGQRRYGPADVAAVQELVSLVAKGWAPATAARAVAAHRDTGAVVFDASLLDAVPIGVVVTNPDGEVLYANPAIAAMLGTTPGELAAASAETFLDEEHRALVAAAFEGMRRGEPQQYEVRLRTPAGGTVDVEVAAGPLRSPAGQHRGVVGIFRDLGRTRELERRAHELAALLDASDEAMASVDRNGIVLAANAAAEALGLESGVSITTLPEALAAPTTAAIGRAVAGESSTFELRTPASGPSFDKQVRVVPYAGGAIVALVDVATSAGDAADASASAASHGVVATLTQAVLTGESSATVIETAVQGVARALDASHVSFVEVTRPEGNLVVRASTTDGEPGLTMPPAAPFSSHVGFALQSQRPIFVQSFAVEKRFDRGPLAGEQEARSGFCVPVRWRPEGLGAISVHSADERHDLTPMEVTFVQSVANVCALALEGKDGSTTEEAS